MKALDAPGTRLFRGHGLNKSFGGVHAVRDISLSISQGEVFAIIGPNGAGKSTLLNLMSGHYQPDSGAVLVLVASIWSGFPRTSACGSG